MENHVADQLAQLGAAAALGAAGALVYDLLRAARLMDRRDRALTHLLDALFALALGGGLLWLALVVGGGELRLYMLTGMVLPALKAAAAGVGFLGRRTAGHVPAAVEAGGFFARGHKKTGSCGEKRLFFSGEVR